MQRTCRWLSPFSVRRWLMAGVALAMVAGAAGQSASSPATVYSWSVFSGHLPYPNTGATDGLAQVATFNGPEALGFAPDGNLYVADSFNNLIRQVRPDGSVTLFAGGPQLTGLVDGLGASARFNRPTGLAVDAAGTLFVVEEFNGTVRKISPTRQVTTLAGSPTSGIADGVGPAAQFYFPRAVTVDRAGVAYVCDTANHCIRRIAPDGTVTTFAGLKLPGGHGTANGTGLAARFDRPAGIALDLNGDLIVADTGNHAIRRVTPAGVVTTLAGANGQPGAADGHVDFARFRQPDSVTVDATGTIFVADRFNSTIRKISRDGLVTTIGGRASEVLFLDPLPGLGSQARFVQPTGVAVDRAGNVFMADGGVIWKGEALLPPSLRSTHASNTVIDEGRGGVLSVIASGTPAPTLQWLRNGLALPGATGASLTLSAVNDADAGLYSVVATSLAGTAIIEVTTVRLGPAPQISQPLRATALTTDGAVVLQIGAEGHGSLTYIWRVNGDVIFNQSGSTLLARVPGSYTVTISNPAGSVTSAALELQGRLSNVAARTNNARGSGPLIVGFTISGPAESAPPVLVRGVGPTLGVFGVTDAVREPTLALYRGDTLLLQNSGWETGGDAARLATTAAAVGAFPLQPGGRDAALLAPVGPGSYTVHVNDRTAGGGTVLAELYETSAGSARVTNLSLRNDIARGPLIAGFVVSGNFPARVLIRGIGPTLARFGLANALLRTRLILRSETAEIASNSGWSSARNVAEIADASRAVGAFDLAIASGDSALAETLPAGNYTVELQSGSAGPPVGEALIEIYHVP